MKIDAVGKMITFQSKSFQAVLGSQIPGCQSYISTFEPYLEDSSSFPKMQVRVDV